MKTNIERIESTSKAHQRIARNAAEYAYNHRDWTYSDIWDAYGKPSVYKVRAWEYCRELCANMGGWDMLISSKNTMQFSVVFRFTDENGRVGYAYITRDHDRFCFAE